MKLTRKEALAIADYIFQHSRSSPKSTAYKVYLKLIAFIEAEQGETFGEGYDGYKF